MAELADIQDDIVRGEIDEFVENDVERQRIIDLFAPTDPAMQAVAAGVIEGDHHKVDELVQAALADGISALTVMNDGLTSGMAIVGIKFRENIIFVPEVLGCARAMKRGMVYIEPILAASGIEPIGKVVIGTVKVGDAKPGRIVMGEGVHVGDGTIVENRAELDLLIPDQAQIPARSHVTNDGLGKPRFVRE